LAELEDNTEKDFKKTAREGLIILTNFQMP